jgi:acyl carrier protein
MPLTEASLKEFMRDSLGVDVAPITAETRLFTDGIIDSFALVTLLSHIEEACGFRVRPDEVTLDNFDSIACMLAYAERRAAAT